VSDAKSNDFLSQEEIDALLRSGTESLESTPFNQTSGDAEDTLSLLERDVLGEIGNISFGTASTTLSMILNQKVDITTPKVDIIEVNQLEEMFTYPHVAVSVDYTDGLEGTNVYFLKIEDAGVIANLMMGGDGHYAGEALGELELSAVQEAMNQMMGSAATSMATLIRHAVNISPPKVKVLDMPSGDRLDQFAAEKKLVRVFFQLKIGSLVDSSIMQLTPISFAKALVSRLMNGDAHSSTEPATDQKMSERHMSETVDKQSDPQHDSPSRGDASGRNSESTTQAPGEMRGARHEKSLEQPSVQMPHPSHHTPVDRGEGVQAAPVAFTDFEHFSRAERKGPDNLDLLLDVPLKVTVELGRTKKTIKDILQFAPGSIIELDKLAGEPVDIFVNQKLIARGEVVVIDENFGVRITHIVDQWERLKTLE